MEDKYFCEERFCNSFVDKNHRCEQWSNAVRIPAGAIKAIRVEALRDAADRAMVFAIDEGLIGSSKIANRLRAAIYAGEVKE